MHTTIDCWPCDNSLVSLLEIIHERTDVEFQTKYNKKKWLGVHKQRFKKRNRNDKRKVMTGGKSFVDCINGSNISMLHFSLIV